LRNALSGETKSDVCWRRVKLSQYHIDLDRKQRFHGRNEAAAFEAELK